MKKHSIKLTALVLALVLTAALALTGCGSKSDDSDGATTIQIAVPNDTTNEARALLLLQDNGIIKLADGAGITATKNDIVENPYNVEIVETEAAQIPNILQDVDYAVINAGLNPVADSLVIEGSSSAYANILAVKEGNESSPKVLALIAALESQQVVDYINEKYDGSVVSTVENPTDGFDATVDYDALAGETISIAASPTPHAEILEIVKSILAEKNITLDIQVYNDYVQHRCRRRHCRRQLLPAQALPRRLQRREQHPHRLRCRHPRRAHGPVRRQADHARCTERQVRKKGGSILDRTEASKQNL